jgi:hypothetical protein
MANLAKDKGLRFLCFVFIVTQVFSSRPEGGTLSVCGNFKLNNLYHNILELQNEKTCSKEI